MNREKHRIFLEILLPLFVLLAGLLTAGCEKRRRSAAPAPPPEAPRVPSPLDGKGAASLLPPLEVRAREARSWHILYTAGKGGIHPGGSIWVQVPPFWNWTPPQNEHSHMAGYVSASVNSAEAKIQLETIPMERIILVGVVKGFLREGETIAVVYGDDGGGKNPEARALADRFAEEGERFFIKVDGDGDKFFQPLQEHPTFRVLPREIRSLTISVPSFVKVGDPFPVTLAALDGYLNRAEGFEGKVKVFVLQGGGGIELPEEVGFPKESRGAVRFFTTAKETGIFNLVAEWKEMEILRVSNPLFVLEKSPEFNLYWGDLQGHSNWSDGSASPRQFHEYARDVAGLQVVALTDHDHHGLLPLDEAPHLWEDLKTIAAEFNEPGRFVAFPAYEWTSWKYGHKHVLFLKDDAPLLSNVDPRYDTPRRLWDGLKGREALTISHHTGWGEAPTDWNFYDPLFETVVEIYSVHGSSEYFNCPECVHRPARGSFVQDALSRGHLLGIVGSGDTHNGHPGIDGPPVITGGIAGIYARNLSREGIFEALRARRVYGTSGSRIILDFRVNGAMMGSVLKLSSPDDPREITVEVVGHKAIERIEVLKNNTAVFVKEGGGLASTLTLRDPEPAKKGDFYYVRVTQADDDKEKAWSSPIWIDWQKG